MKFHLFFFKEFILLFLLTTAFSAFENLGFSESVRGIIQMSENTILFLEYVWALINRLHIVWISIYRIWST